MNEECWNDLEEVRGEIPDYQDVCFHPQCAFVLLAVR